VARQTLGETFNFSNIIDAPHSGKEVILVKFRLTGACAAAMGGSKARFSSATEVYFGTFTGHFCASHGLAD
jgi:hypothetical protein